MYILYDGILDTTNLFDTFKDRILFSFSNNKSSLSRLTKNTITDKEIVIKSRDIIHLI